MPIPRFRKQQNEQQSHASFESGFYRLTYPVHKLLAIYARQSTAGQVVNNRESYESQTQDLLRRAMEMGWKEESIIVYIENVSSDGVIRGASGRLRIDQREGLSALVERILSGEIGAVMVYQEDRLFRDETGIQYNVFIDLCKRNGVIVITPMYSYDFNNDRYAVRLFRDKMQQAADFYLDYSKRMHDLKNRVSERGEYDGRTLSVGYIVDRDKHSPTYRKFIVYEPHARVVRWMFKRYRELGGNLRALCRELEALPFLLPEFEDYVDARDRTRFCVKPVPGGFHLSRSGVALILTNVAYVGWWTFRGQVIKKNNHPSIVDEDDFWYAFNRLSEYTPDGRLNELYSKPTRYTQGNNEIQALLKYKLEAVEGSAYVSNIHERGPSYVIRNTSRLSEEYAYSVKASFLDEVVVARMFDICQNEYLGDDILDAIEQLRKQKQEPLITVDQQLESIAPQIAGLLASLRLPESILDAQSRADIATQLRDLRSVEQELLNKKQAANAMFAEKKDVDEYRDILNNIPERWYGLPLEKKLKVIELVIERITIKECAPHWLGLQIEWRGFYGRVDTGYIWRAVGTRNEEWREEELDIIREHYPMGNRDELLHRLPVRSWVAIGQAASTLGVRRTIAERSDAGIPKSACIVDVEFMNTVGILPCQIKEPIQAFWYNQPYLDVPSISTLEGSSKSTLGHPRGLPAHLYEAGHYREGRSHLLAADYQ